MNLIKKVGAFTTVAVFIIGMIYGGLQIMFIIGDNMTEYKKQLIKEAVEVDVSNYDVEVEVKGVASVEDPEVAEAVCFFLVMEKGNTQMFTKFWDERINECRKDRLNGPSSVTSNK